MSAAPLAWVAGFGGAYLIYAAVTNRSPSEQLRAALTGQAPPVSSPLTRPAGVGTGTAGGGGTGSTPASTPSTSASFSGSTTTAGTLDLVSIGGVHRLVRGAAAAYEQAVIDYGKPIPITDSYRTAAQQAECYRTKPQYCSPPGHSKHERGEAIDVNQTMNLDEPALVAALTKNGWVRRGKVIVYKGVTRNEPWHWSWGGPG